MFLRVEERVKKLQFDLLLPISYETLFDAHYS